MMSPTVFLARLITALLLLVSGFVVLWESYDLPFGTLNRIQAGFFPNLFGGLMSALSLVLLWQLYRSKKKGFVTKNASDEEEEPVNLRGAFIFTGILVLFVLVTYGFGFLAASVVSIAAAGYALGLKNWRLAVLAIGTAAVVWLIFDIWLGVSLPRGMWL
jgi:hypothetical protein